MAITATDPPKPPPEPIEDRRLFADEHGFFRSSKYDKGIEDPFARIDIREGVEFSEAEASTYARRFFDILADGRPVQEYDDVFEFADRNGLLMLVGPKDEAKFHKLIARMPQAHAARWQRMLGGEIEASAFHEAVREEEDRLQREARAGRVRAIRSAVGAGVAIAVLAGFASWFTRGGEEETVGRIFFGVEATKDGPKLILGDAPAVNRNLLVRLDSTVGVVAGTQPEAERVRSEFDAALLPQAPSAVSATLFQYGGRGQVVIVGPTGFTPKACLQVSAVSINLRPFDTVRYEGSPGACPTSIVGRAARVGCIGDNAIMLELQFPEGEVDLEEGGKATIGGVRVLSAGKASGFESVSIRGSIAVGTGKAEPVPRFGGAPGEQVSFDMTPPGAATPEFGRCTLR